MASVDEQSVMDLIDESPHPGRETIPAGVSSAESALRLNGRPFADNVNPRFFYRTEAHLAAFDAMMRCVEDDVSLGLTTAVSGTGKTLLTQVLLREFDSERYRPALILVYPGISRTALLRDICAELEIEVVSKRPRTHDLIEGIQQRIMDLYLEGTKIVLIIDEVHFLKADCLQVLRTLSNVEVPEKKLVTVLLFGEESFLPKLDKPTYRSILSRMFTRVHLRPLTEPEIEQYVKFRLLMVEGPTDLFAPECFEWLAEHTGGIPREINRVCHFAVSEALRQGLRKVGPELLSRADLQET